MSDNKNHFIDLLRFLSALWVAFFHFNEPIVYIDNWYRNFLKLGYLGVPVFFVISGYCVILSATNVKSMRTFLIRRLFRIFPPYLFSLLIVLVVVIILKILNGYNCVTVLPKTTSEILLTISLLTYPFSHVKGINWVYWSLTYEAFFYIIIGLSLSLPAKIQIHFLILVSLLALLLPIYPSGPLFFLRCWPIFALGICIYFMQQRNNYILVILLIIINILATLKTFLLNAQTAYFVTTIISVLLISLSIKYKLRDNILSKFGNYSYSVYLFHVPLGAYLMGNFKTLTIQQNMYLNIAYDIISFIITFGLAYLAYRFIELPSIKAGKIFTQKTGPEQIQLASKN